MCLRQMRHGDAMPGAFRCGTRHSALGHTLWRCGWTQSGPNVSPVHHSEQWSPEPQTPPSGAVATIAGVDIRCQSFNTVQHRPQWQWHDLSHRDLTDSAQVDALQFDTPWTSKLGCSESLRPALSLPATTATHRRRRRRHHLPRQDRSRGRGPGRSPRPNCCRRLGPQSSSDNTDFFRPHPMISAETWTIRPHRGTSVNALITMGIEIEPLGLR